MSIETFDWQGYMSDIGYAPEEIPNEINDEDREWLYGLWARDLMEQLNYEARQNPFLATAEEKRNDARDKFLQYAPDLAHFFGNDVQSANPDSTFDPEAFRDHVVNNEIQNANLGYYLDTFAASRINDDTEWKYPWLKGMTKDQFKRSFMEQQDIDEAWTSVDDIREGNFGTLAAAYQAQQAQEAPPKSGHMAALKQGWYEFEKLFGYTIGTLGDAVGVNWLSDIGNEIAENVIKKSDAYNYQSKYNQSLADTIKNEGVMSGAGKILNMAEENWATTAAPLALAAIGKILSTYAHVPQPLANAATNAVAANLVRRQGSALLRRASRLAYASSAALSGLEIGGVRAELEEHEKYDPNNVADVVAAGLVSSSLDFIGNVAAFKGMTITARRLFQSRLTTEAARANLAREIAEDQAKSFTHRVLSAMAVEGITEGLQEIPAMVVGARRGIDYTSKEVRDRIIDAAAVGSFMGGGVRAAEIALEKYHRGDDETPADTEQETPPETPEAPETPPPSPPPPPGFDGQLPLMGMNYYETENGFSVFDKFNVGYGATREEASRDFLDNANKGRVDIDPNNIQSPSPGESVVRYGNNDQHSVRVIGQGSDALIRKIVDLHNDPKNAVNLQGDNVFNVSDFQADDDQSIRSVLEQRKTGRGYNANVIANRENAVDIPVNLGAVNRTDMSGTYAALNLDDATRTALSTKGFVILSNPRSINSGRDQRLLLYRDGFVYTVTLNNGATDENVSASVEAESLEQINKRLRIRDKNARDKARTANVKSNFLEAGVRRQGLRTVTVNPVSNTSTTTENKSSITIAPVLRSVPDLGFVEISQTTNNEGVETLTFDPRKILEGRVKKANGKIEKIGARGIKYTSAGETIRLDVTADGRVLVSRDGRFVGDYEFVPADIGNGERRASFQSTEIEATQPFHVVDIPEELQFEGRVLFVYKGDDTVEEASREYYAIANNGDVHYLSNTENNYVRRLLRLPYIQNLNDARDVFGDQFVEFYVEPRFDDNGQLIGFQDKGELLYTFDLTDENTRQFADDEVDALIQRGYNKDFIKVWAIVTPDRRRIVRATTQEGVAQFVEDLKGYANVLDQSEWNPSSRAESIFDNSVYNEQGLYGSEDLYGVMYQTPLYSEGVSNEDLNADTVRIENATKEIVSQIEEDIEALRGERRKGRIHLSGERIDAYQFAVSSIKQGIYLSETSAFDYVSESDAGFYARNLNEIARRRFYRIRTAQALLHVDLYRNKLSSFTNVINRTELDNILTNEVGSYSENLTLEELRERTIQAESIALRLEEAYINTFRLSDASKTTTLLWNSIYPDTIQGNYGSFVNRIHSEGTDFRFSRNTQTPRVQRRNAILDELRERRVLGAFALNEMLEKGFRGESGGLRILASQEEAHEVERMFTTDATQPYYDNGGLIQGFVAPDGIIYLVEDGIVDGRVRQVLLHEFGVHARKFGMTDGEFQEIIQGIKAKREEQSPDGDFVRKCITRAKEANPKLTEDNPLFWEEVAAYTVEHGYEISDNSVFGRLQAWIKRWLWRFGFIDASVLHYQDLVMFAQGMLNKSGPLRFFDGMFDYTKQQDVNKNITQFSRTILAEDTPEREEFAQRTYRRLRGLDDAIERERNGESADAIEQATDWRRNDNGNWGIRYSRINVEGARRLDISDPRGLTTRMMEYDLAVQMEAEGRSEAEIKALTNWTRGNDGLWGYEVVDKDMTFEIPGLSVLKNELEEISIPKEEFEKYLKEKMYEEILQKYFPGAPRSYSRDLLSNFNLIAKFIRFYEENFLGYSDIEKFRAALTRDILQSTGQAGAEYVDEFGKRVTIYEGWSEFHWPLAISEYEHTLELLKDETLTEGELIATLEQESGRIVEKYRSAIDNYNNEVRERVHNTENFEKLLKEEFPKRMAHIKRLEKAIDSLYKTKRNLSTVFSHPQLFSAYPELKGVQIKLISMWPWQLGYMEEKENADGTSSFEIVINKGLDEESIKSTLIHEVQHVIQSLSGFARGGNTRMFEDAEHLQKVKSLKLESHLAEIAARLTIRRLLKDYVISGYLNSEPYQIVIDEDGEFSSAFYIRNKTEKTYETYETAKNFAEFRNIYTLTDGRLSSTLKELLGETFYNYLKQEHSSLLKEAEKNYNEAQQRKLKADNEYRELTDEPYQKYRRLMGELEARVTERRMNMTEEEMRQTPISETEREFEGIEKEELIDPRDLKEVVNGEPGGESELRYSRATTEDLKPYKSFINDLEDNLVRERISGVPREGDTVLYQRGDVNEFITRDSLYTVEDAADYYPDLEQRWIDYHRDDSESNFIRYSRSIPEIVYDTHLEEEAQRQYEEIRNRYYGTEEWLKVRDKNTGELVNSNLDERQWIHVRTQFFKNWFGDWENNPQNASKVLDEHGEPLVVYHGSPIEDLVSLVNRSEIEGNERGFRGTGDAGIYFSPKRSYAERYTSSDLTKEESGGRVYEMFLNIRNPATLRESGLTTIDKISREEAQRIQDSGYDGIMHEHRKRPEYVIFNSLQVRSATENVGTYGATGTTEFRYSRNMRPYNRNENRAELRRAINELEQVSLPETIVFEPEEDDKEIVDYGTYTNRYYDDYSEEWVDESYDLRFYAPTESTIPELLRESFGVRFVRDVEEADLIQAQYEKAMSRQSDYIGDLWRHLLSRNGILYEDNGSYLAGRASGNAFMISHFAPKNLKDGARMMKEIANGHMSVIAAVPPYQGSMLEKVGFRMIGQIPQIFGGELVLKNVYVNRAASDQDIQYAYDEYADGMTPEQLNTLIENAKIVSGRRESGDSPIRFSRATTTSTPEDSLPQTPKQRGTAIPNAPGVYRMPDGSLHIEPSELPVGFENETILYAAIAISDPAKEEKRIAELRDAIAANDDLLNATDQIMQERGDTNEDHRLGYGVSLILSDYDPISDLYQLTVDAFHEAVSKATGGAYQNLVLDTSQIEAAAHAIAGMPYEPFQTAPQETVPTPRPNGADIDRERLQQAFDQSDAQRQNMQVGADGRAFISTDDSDVDVVFEKRVTNPLETGQLTDDVLMGTAQYGEADDFYNHLADDPHHGTQEPLDTGRFAQPADLDRAAVENFLANAIPEHIWNRMEILWEDNAENRAILGNALGVFRPLAWQNKNIVIQGWDRSFGQVVRTAAREASRFGWSMWQNRDFRNAFTDFYDTFVNPIYEELRPYYNQMGITDPRQLSDDQKIFMVQTFFSKLNQSLFTDDVTDMGNVLGITQAEYRQVLANVRRGISTQENDLSRFLGGFAGDAALAKEFAAQVLRMTMETATNIGTHFIYERSSVSGQKDRIRIYTNEWGTWRKKIYDTRFAKVAEQIKENLSWWRNRFHGDPKAERFARFMMRNLPMGFWPLKYLHLYVPDARLGDTTLGRASQMIARVWQKIGDLSGTTIAQDYALMEDIHEILREHGYDPLVTDDMETRRQTYQEFFRSLGITSAKAMEKARLADNVVSSSEQLRAEGAANIRSIIAETGVSLYERMARAGVPQGDIERMVDKFERKRQRFHDDYQHRMYEAFTPEGKSELARMIRYLERDPVTGEETIAKRARRAREAIDRAEARWGRGTSRFYKETEEARKEVRRYERLVHLQNFERAILMNRKTNLVGAELNEAVLRAMKNRINTIILDHQSVGRFDSKAVPHYNYISGQKLPQLNPENPFHKEYMDFLGEIKDPMRIAVYSADQQRQIIAKLQFNKELGEYLLDNNMASLRGAPSADGLIRDLAQMETGSFLEYVNIDPEFMPEIKAEYENMQKVAETVLSGLVDAVKANSTVYSLRLAMNNYIGNFSMLLASGHFWRFGQWMSAGEIVKKQFLDRFTYGAKDPSDFAKMIIKEMEDAMVTGGSGTEMTVFQLNKGAHENFIRVFTGSLMNWRVLTKGGKFRIDNFVNRSLEYARKFYTYGDEWVKPLMYINNRMNAIAKYEAITERKSGETQEEYEERIMRKAIEEASEMTLRETVSWENSPFFIRQLSTKSIRFFVPDFLLHNFQMLRITASNYVRLWEITRELRNFDPTRMNPDKAAAYRSSLVKEFTQRSVGGAMTAGVYAGLAGATGSCMAFIPYMMNTVFAAIDGEDDKDKDKTFFNPQEWEGAQRILNYKTGGDNFFVPAWKHNGKIYAWNYGRASVMLTHAIPHPATDNPEFTDYASQFFKNVVNIGGGTIAQEILNNIQGKDKWGRDIGVSAGVGRVVERVFVPGAVRQLMDMSVGYPFAADNPYREGKAIKMSDAVGITVNAYDMRDIVNEIGWNMGRVQSSSQNVHRKNFVKRLADSDALSDAQVVSLVNDMRESNARDFDKANYVLTGLRQMGMENKDIAHWLTVSRKDANTILSKKQANAFLKGKNIYDENLVTYLKNKRNNLAKGEDDVRMSREELAVVLQNYDKAIRIYSQALRAQ